MLKFFRALLDLRIKILIIIIIIINLDNELYRIKVREKKIHYIFVLKNQLASTQKHCSLLKE